jgi:hypothetical protein
MANVTKTTAAAFIPELWSEAILGYAEAQFSLKDKVTDFSSLLVGGGDIINIPKVTEETAAEKAADTAVTYGANTDSSVALSVNQHFYEAKRIEDIVKVQESADLFNMYAKSMGYALAKKVESYIASVIQGATGNDVTLATDNTPTAAEIRSGLAKLVDNNVDYTNGETYLYASPGAYMNLLGLQSDTNWENALGENGLYSIPLTASTHWDDDGGTGDETISIFTKDSVGFAMSIAPRVQSSYDIDHLATSVVADVLFGAVVLQDGQISNFNNP